MSLVYRIVENLNFESFPAWTGEADAQNMPALVRRRGGLFIERVHQAWSRRISARQITEINRRLAGSNAGEVKRLTPNHYATASIGLIAKGMNQPVSIASACPNAAKVARSF